MDLRDEIGKLVSREQGRDNWASALMTADAILALPAIKEALNFHEAAKKAFAVNGRFEVTEDNVASSGNSWT
jgi:hypothetical protein